MRFDHLVLYSGPVCVCALVLSGCSSSLMSANSPTSATPSGAVPTVIAVGEQVNGVAPNRKQEVQFSEAMDAATINTQSFQVTDSSGKLAQGTVSYDPDFETASFLPNPALQTGAAYRATITTAAASTGGMHLASAYTYAFTTRSDSDTSPLIVNSVSPAAGATCVSANTPIIITFDEAPDASTLTAANFAVTGPGGPIAVKISTNVTTTQVVLTPASPLPSGAITVTVNHVADLAGVAMAASYTWSFSTTCGGGGGGGGGIAGVSFSSTTYSSNLLWNPFYFSNFVTHADLNGDGRDDFVTSADYCPPPLSNGIFSVSLSTGDGTYGPTACYTLPTAPLLPVDFAIADFFGDGHLSVAVTDEKGNMTLWKNKGDGTLTLAPTPAIPSGDRCTLTGDINHDGTIDLVCQIISLTSGNNLQFQVLFGSGDGTFAPGPVTQYTAQSGLGQAALADFDGDGNLDILTMATGGVETQIFYGDSTGKFTAGSDLRQVTSGNGNITRTKYQDFDVNSDGIMDLIGSPFTQPPSCGTGCFGPPATFDNYLDIEIGHSDRTLTSQQIPLPNCQTSSLTPQVADFDGDGVPDIVVSCLSTGQSTLDFLKGNGNGTFQPAQVIYSTSDVTNEWFVMKTSPSGLPGLAVSQYQDVNNSVNNMEEVILVNTTR